MAVVGVPGALMLAGALTLVQRHTASTHRGRVFGSLSAVEGIAVVSGTIAAGLLGRTVGIIPVLAAQGAGYLVAGLAVVIVLRDEQSSKPPGTDQSTGGGDRVDDRIGISVDGPATAARTA